MSAVSINFSVREGWWPTVVVHELRILFAVDLEKRDPLAATQLVKRKKNPAQGRGGIELAGLRGDKPTLP
jgi:hypothetical protein